MNVFRIENELESLRWVLLEMVVNRRILNFFSKFWQDKNLNYKCDVKHPAPIQPLAQVFPIDPRLSFSNLVGAIHPVLSLESFSISDMFPVNGKPIPKSKVEAPFWKVRCPRMKNTYLEPGRQGELGGVWVLRWSPSPSEQLSESVSRKNTDQIQI